MPKTTADARQLRGTDSHVTQIRVTLPIRLDEWCAERSTALGLSKSSFVRMIILQYKGALNGAADD